MYSKTDHIDRSLPKPGAGQQRRASGNCWSRVWAITLLFAFGALTGTAQAADPLNQVSLQPLSMAESYALGINEFALSNESKMTGWQVAESFGGDWYFGQKQGRGSGLSLVWQKSTDQVSISATGIRFTRSF